jgi:hypothetical protein
MAGFAVTTEEFARSRVEYQLVYHIPYMRKPCVFPLLGQGIGGT